MGRTILITGATGQQGGATLRSLVEHNKSTSNPINLLALTRNATSDKAKPLSSLPNVKVIQGDLTKKDEIEKIFEDEKIDSVFSIQDNFQGNEVEQGTNLTEVAIKYNVKHFVYTGVDLAGQNPSLVPHFETKRQIEEHLIKNSSRIASQILISQGEKEEFKNQIINLSGDSHTVSEIIDTFKQVKQVDLVQDENVDIVPYLTIALATINGHGWEVNPESTQRLFPFVKDLKGWLETEFNPDFAAGGFGTMSNN
ncbi:uncharacterized protein L201_000845 [Kwoniella dendrophila CBS 6074]|uniref:NmrA-like domain-containing protein n=1 Tax=Kwoniella dendrophila CBS 6074 TaxID=1295534 RepID=A0AAX4JMH2_9TREE